MCEKNKFEKYFQNSVDIRYNVRYNNIIKCEEEVKMTNLKNEFKSKLAKLNFDECVTLYKEIDAGNPVMDLIFDRMEEIDSSKFEMFLDGVI